MALQYWFPLMYYLMDSGAPAPYPYLSIVNVRKLVPVAHQAKLAHYLRKEQ
jgi:hypothetical protein